jgi:N12 class adenine-specific DNA methylase
MQPKITDKTLENNVCDVDEFEYTSSQKFVSQFISPNTPYNGILLYHGVGVGKTCSAILAAEAFLQLSPKNKVYILAPPAIQAGFYRTIFDSSRIVFGKDDQQNRHEGCTGNRYLELTQTLYERDRKDIELRVGRLINKRYAIMGYVAFRNMVRDIKSQIASTLPAKRKEEQNTILLQRALSGSLFIVDEAHNLRDVSETAEDDDDDLGDRSDAAAGKKLTPMLREVLQKCEGNKLMLMSATPMYNSYKEIVSLLNLLLLVSSVFVLGDSFVL